MNKIEDYNTISRESAGILEQALLPTPTGKKHLEQGMPIQHIGPRSILRHD